MYTVIVILILIVSVLLAGVVLIQNSKGGGLAANFSAPQQVLGARGTADFLEKATWWLAGIMVVLCLAATISVHSGRAEDPMQTEVKVSDFNPVQPQQTIPMEVTIPAEE
ncbi:MAG: preprotein translocase subunit SecG [Bacteroidales bacterium]|nr:preprotein translocase subunit SecG [Bacteroidales bacterium]